MRNAIDGSCITRGFTFIEAVYGGALLKFEAAEGTRPRMGLVITSEKLSVSPVRYAIENMAAARKRAEEVAIALHRFTDKEVLIVMPPKELEALNEHILAVAATHKLVARPSEDLHLDGIELADPQYGVGKTENYCCVRLVNGTLVVHDSAMTAVPGTVAQVAAELGKLTAKQVEVKRAWHP